MPTFGLYYRIEVKDKNGKVRKRTRWRKAKSWTLQFLQHLEFVTMHAYSGTHGTFTILDTGNTARNFGVSAMGLSEIFAIRAPDDAESYGIILGTSDQAVQNTDYVLIAPIAHGVGIGELDYGASSITTAAVVGANVDLVLSRAFYNGSGAIITVKEIGIYAACKDDGGVVRYLCVCRDVIAPVDILDTETASAQYTLRTTV